MKLQELFRWQKSPNSASLHEMAHLTQGSTTALHAVNTGTVSVRSLHQSDGDLVVHERPNVLAVSGNGSYQEKSTISSQDVHK
jgi:hypothetical protein